MRPSDAFYAGGRRTPTQSDLAAMRADNTSAFNCRPVTGNPYRVSQHSYGNAIDINTVREPVRRRQPGLPGLRPHRTSTARTCRPGMITRGGVLATHDAAARLALGRALEPPGLPALLLQRGLTPRARCHARGHDRAPAPAPLEPLTEDWERALCVVAHPDDLEFGGAAAVARWTGQGKQVVYCMVTSGEAGIDGMHPDECRERPRGRAGRVRAHRRRRRGRLPRAARRHPGVRRPAAPRDRRGGPPAPARHRDHQQLPRHLGRPEPQPGRPHRHRQGRARRRPRRRQPVGLPRAARRRASSRGAACRRCGRRLPRRPTHAVDITDTFDAGVASLRAHRAYIDGLGWEDFDPAEFLEGMSRATGQRLGRRARRRRSRCSRWAGAS